MTEQAYLNKLIQGVKPVLAAVPFTVGHHRDVLLHDPLTPVLGHPDHFHLTVPLVPRPMPIHGGLLDVNVAGGGDDVWGGLVGIVSHVPVFMIQTAAHQVVVVRFQNLPRTVFLLEPKSENQEI